MVGMRKRDFKLTNKKGVLSIQPFCDLIFEIVEIHFPFLENTQTAAVKYIMKYIWQNGGF
jgi:hypothetical protein